MVTNGNFVRDMICTRDAYHSKTGINGNFIFKIFSGKLEVGITTKRKISADLLRKGAAIGDVQCVNRCDEFCPWSLSVALGLEGTALGFKCSRLSFLAEARGEITNTLDWVLQCSQWPGDPRSMLSALRLGCFGTLIVGITNLKNKITNYRSLTLHRTF